MINYDNLYKIALGTVYGTQCIAYPKPKKVYYTDESGTTVVIWMDGTKTIVRPAEGDPHNAYLGYCAALAKKVHGTNSALKRDLEKVLVLMEKKEKKKNEDSVY